MGLAMATPVLFLFMHAGFLVLCLGYGFPHVLAGPVQGGNETDRLALLAFKSAITGDPYGALNSWNESIHFCQWFGVTCGGRRHQRVTGLRLLHQKLAEYGMGNEVSTLGDVYSYGILLLEMFTGKRPTDSMFSDGLNLHTFAKTALPDQVANIVDPSLFQQLDMGEASLSLNNTSTQNSPISQKILECLVLILQVGIACSQELPTDRMDINDVVSQLHAIRNSVLKAVTH